MAQLVDKSPVAKELEKSCLEIVFDTLKDRLTKLMQKMIV